MGGDIRIMWLVVVDSGGLCTVCGMAADVEILRGGKGQALFT